MRLAHCPLRSGRVDACDFPKRGKLECVIYGSGGLFFRNVGNLSLDLVILLLDFFFSCEKVGIS